MPLIRRVPWTAQPQSAAPYDRAALAKFNICGGFIIGGANWTPPNFSGTSPGVAAGTQLYIDSSFYPKPAPFGRSGSIFDSGGARYFIYTMGSPSSRNFTFSAKVKYNQARTLILRSGNTGSGTTILLWRNSGFDMRVNGTDYTAAGTWNLDQWYDIQIVGTTTSCVLYVDGVAVINGAAAAAGNLDADFAIGDVTGGGLVDTDHFELGHCVIANRAWAGDELNDFRRNPWQLFESRRIIIPVSAGAGGGTAAGLAAETDTALALTGVQRKAAGLAAETDTALARGGVQIKLAGRADEIDTALALLIGGGSSVGLAAETDTALALAGRQIKPAGLAAETDTALTLAGRLIKAAGLAAEADVAFALAGRQIRAVGRANEVDTALSLLTGAGGSAGMAAETDTAFALPGIQIKLVGRANEVDSAFALYLAGAGPAREYLYLMSAISTSATRTSAITPAVAASSGITRAVTLQSAIDIESTP